MTLLHPTMKESTVIHRLSALFVAIALCLGIAAPVAANGIGDLYVGSPEGIDEFYMSGESLVNRVAIEAPALGLAFSDDGMTLYAATGTSAVAKVDIETLTVAGTLRFDGQVTRLAAALNQRLVALLPEEESVAFANLGDGHMDEIALPIVPDLLAAHRAHTPVAVGERGESTLLIVTEDGITETITLPGALVDAAIDQRSGYVAVVVTGPNLLLGYDLANGNEVDRDALPVAPTAVGTSEEGVIVATGATLHRFGGFGQESGVGGVSESWVADGSVEELAASESGAVIFARHGESVTAYTTEGLEIGQVSGEGIAVIAPIVGPVSVGPGAVDKGADLLPATASGSISLFWVAIAAGCCVLIAIGASRLGRRSTR
jgi:hypothetical protein